MIHRLTILAVAAFALASPAYADCASELSAVAQRHQAAGPFRVESRFTVNGQPRTTVTQVVPPDRIHQVKLGSESVIAGDAMWVRQRGKWVRAPLVIRPIDVAAIHVDLADRIASASRRQCLGERQRGGKDFVAYHFTSRHKAGGFDAVWATELTVDAATGLPVTAETNRGTPAAFVDTYTYDRSIAVTLPE